ncbi:MAG: sigma-54 dependent transcriptional regulator [Candidatus Hydrogenedentes bacterium]|nr:sigma-54 dependent transcriptional regulator [Candidatus Hydrogenedentota bacterium]
MCVHHEAIVRFGRLVGGSPQMVNVYALIEKAARVDVPVLIAGETGTGKELAAREIHARGKRKDAPFIAVNTGVLSSELVASELFGHAKGSFTGAIENRIGRFAEADGGTLFLDEIATMEEGVQVAFLRVLEQGVFRPVGGKQNKQADVRLIAATNVDLRHAVDSGAFREDLVHRLQVFFIMLPALREHMSDLPMLTQHFLELTRNELAITVNSISQDALDLMELYSWPGNIRELKNAIAQAAVMCDTGIIEPRHLPDRVTDGLGQIPPDFGARDSAAETRLKFEPPPQTDAAALITASPARAETQPKQYGEGRDGVFIPLGSSLDEVQKAYVLKTLSFCSNNKTHAARMLGVSRKTLYDRLTRWGIT